MDPVELPTFRGIEYLGRWNDGTRKGSAWVYGYFYVDVEGTHILDNSDPYNLVDRIVYEETLTMSTGYKDKYKNRIYEGDIIKVDPEEEQVALVLRRKDGFYLRWKNGEIGRFSDFVKEDGSNVEVVGNMFITAKNEIR